MTALHVAGVKSTRAGHGNAMVDGGYYHWPRVEDDSHDFFIGEIRFHDDLQRT
jgi:hypothetical protein